MAAVAGWQDWLVTAATPNPVVAFAQELQALIKYIGKLIRDTCFPLYSCQCYRLTAPRASLVCAEINKSTDMDWFTIKPNKDGTHWEGKCWYIHEYIKYEFDFQVCWYCRSN